MNETVHVILEQHNDLFVVQIPGTLPDELGAALKQNLVCIPRLSEPGVLLCTEQYWQRMLQGLPGVPRKLLRVMRMMQVSVERSRSGQLCIPILPLLYTQVRGPALMTLRQDGTIHLTADTSNHE